MGQYNGAFVLHHLSIRPSGDLNEGAQFENLWAAALIQCALPTITLIMIPYFIPDKKQNERLITEDATGVEGSEYRKWQGIEDQPIEAGGGEFENRSPLEHPTSGGYPVM